MPEPVSVEHIHEHLKAYCQQQSPLLLLRYRRIEERCTDMATENGAIVRWTDNSPAWDMHHAAYPGVRLSEAEFATFVRSIPCRMFAAKNNSINKAKWYVAHIFAVKADRRGSGEMTHGERVARFVRDIHPANHFYFPSVQGREGRFNGEHRQVIQYMAAFYRRRYSSVWTEFLDLAMARDGSSTGEGDPQRKQVR